MDHSTAVIEPTGQSAAAHAGYVALPGVYDEMVAANGQIRPVWRTIADWFASRTLAEQTDRATRIGRLVGDNFADPARGGTPWRLDLSPLMLDTVTWQALEAAAIQRARLYQALLADLYADQTAFRDGVLPSALVHNDIGFLRPLHGFQPSAGHLTFLALDFARDPQGNWRIIDVHAETPAGHGYVLANRLVLAEVLGGTFRRTGARRIGQFFLNLGDDLLSRTNSDQPTIAMLTARSTTPGFEGHAFMARYLGHLRVHGTDLRIVGNRAYLKTVNGLQKIDLIVRAIEGHRADPLELAPDGFDGPVGFVEACRQTPDLVVNALGSAIVENRGFSGYVGALSKYFLGEDILIPDSPRLWLGDSPVRDQVLANLDSYIIHETREGTGRPGQAAQGRNPSQMSPEARAALVTEIRFRGANLVAERTMGFATAPSWTPDGLRPEPFALRVFAASIGGSFAVMPGGLALTVDAGSTVALSSAAGLSRDVWVVSGDAGSPATSLRRVAAQQSDIHRHSLSLQSRVADDLFWLGRYCERADGNLRWLRKSLERSAADLLARAASEVPFRAIRLLVSKDDEAVPPLPSDGAGTELVDGWIREICTASHKPHSLAATVANIRSVALRVRDRMSGDSWRILNSLSTDTLVHRLPQAATDVGEHDGDDDGAAVGANNIEFVEAIDHMLTRLSAFAGLSHENMTRNTGWRFLELGRRIERARHMVDLLLLLDSKAASLDAEREDLVFVLQAADSYITYRSRYRFAPELPGVLDLLMIDESNPRSIAYQLARVGEQIAALPKSTEEAHRSPEQRLSLDLLTRVRLTEVQSLAQANERGRRPDLQRLLEGLATDLPRLSELLSRQYFSLTDDQPQRILGRARR